jgi:hypothetical protein
LDTTIGVPILWGFLTILSHVVFTAGIHGMRSGEYGHPPKFSWFARQALMYFVGLSCMKFVVYVLLMMPFWDNLAELLLSWTDGHQKLQVAFVMLVCFRFFPFLSFDLFKN